MKKFSTFNGLFTHCGTILPKNLGQNLKQEDVINENFDEVHDDSKNFNQSNNANSNQENKEILHYPQSDNDYPFTNVEKSNFQSIENKENEEIAQNNEQENYPNYSEYTLSHNAKMILECMRMHDKIINNFDKSIK